MIHSQLFSRLPAVKKEGYVLWKDCSSYLPYNTILFSTLDKEEVFKRLKEFEVLGVACYVEDREGKRLS